MPNSADISPGSRRKIALVITELEPGGAERRLTDLALGLAPEQFVVRMYVLAGRPPQGRDELSLRLETAGIAVQYLGCSSAWGFLAAVWRLWGELTRFQPHVLQAFLYHANVVGLLAGWLAGVPRRFAGVRVADPRWGRAWLERHAARLATDVICVSQGTADFCRRRGFHASQLIVIPNGVDFTRFAQAQPAELSQFGVPPDRQVMLFVGRLDPQKGLDRLLPALPKVFDARPDLDLLLIGDGPARDSLQQQAELLGLTGRLHFAGWRGDVAPILAASSLVVLPSRWEGMPNVVLEAMAAGKPVAAAPAEGVLELLGPAADQQTANADDPAQFAALLLRLADDANLRQSLGLANQTRAEAEFTQQAMLARYLRTWFGEA